MWAGQETVRRGGRGWSLLHLQTHGFCFLLWVVPFINPRLQNLALLVLQDDLVIGRSHLSEHSVLLVGELHLFSVF